MYIEELKDGDVESAVQQHPGDVSKGVLVVGNPKFALVGVGSRGLFYPTLLYNVIRNMIQPDFRWWDWVDEHLLLGAVPFPSDVPRLKALGVCGVVTLNEPYETLVPPSLYHHHNIDHLVIPTRDYLFAPLPQDINQAIEFIHRNSLSGRTTYVHCKAGRGRSTTIVLCYLIKHKQMTPESAYEYVRSIRPRVLLASTQWKAVRDYYNELNNPVSSRRFQVITDDLDYNSLVLITESDLIGYHEENCRSLVACRVQFARQVASSRLSFLWLRGQTGQKSQNKMITIPIPGVEIDVC